MKQIIGEEITSKTYSDAISRAEKFLEEGTEQSLLASTLLIINALEATLNLIIYLELQRSMVDVLSQELGNVKIVPTHYGYDLSSILNRISLKDGSTLGEIINHVEKYMLFPEKSILVKSLKEVNSSREKVIHKLLHTTQISGESNIYLKKHVSNIVTYSKKAMNLCYEISDKAGKIHTTKLTQT